MVNVGRSDKITLNPPELEVIPETFVVKIVAPKVKNYI
jgi:hypothetical protein